MVDSPFLTWSFGGATFWPSRQYFLALNATGRFRLLLYGLTVKL